MLADLELVLLDIKAGSEKAYKDLTGRELAPTLEFARRLGEANIPVWVRFVLVPGYTDSRENVERVAKIAAKIPSLERVEVLAFHQMGKDKWEALGLPYELADVQPPTPEQMQAARDVFKAESLPTY